MQKRVWQVLKNKPPIDWTDVRPPTELAVYKMIRNLHAASITAGNSSKYQKQ